MKDMQYVFENFFTHKDYLVSGELIPGTMYTPLQFAFTGVLLAVILASAVWLSRRREKIRTVYTALWFILMVFEVAIITWDSVAGKKIGFDPSVNLSLYPCSIFLYVLPFTVWGGKLAKKIAYGYICTLGMLGAALNFLYPVAHLTVYSCISFKSFHTFFYHGSMLFVYFVTIFSGIHRYGKVTHWWELLLPSAASMLMSIPANIVNYSAIDADYMYFKGKFPLLQVIFAGVPETEITMILYVLYIAVPALFYLPSYLKNRRKVPCCEPYAAELLAELEQYLAEPEADPQPSLYII